MKKLFIIITLLSATLAAYAQKSTTFDQYRTTSQGSAPATPASGGVIYQAADGLHFLNAAGLNINLTLGQVSSVFNRTGAVTAQTGDYTASQVGADASGTAATLISSHNSSGTAHSDIRSAIAGKEASGVAASLTSAHNVDTGSHADIRSAIAGKEASGVAASLTSAHNVDTSAHSFIQGLISSEASTRSGADSTLQTAIDGKAASSHTHAASAITDFASAVSSNSDVAANTSARHSHSNKTLLDAISSAPLTDAPSDGSIYGRRNGIWYAVGSGGSGTGDMLGANNLSELTNAATARTNLGLGDSATKSVGTASGTVAAGDHSHTPASIGAAAASHAHAASDITSGTLDAARLPASGVTAGTVGSSSAVPVLTYDSYGRITAVTTAAISGGASAISSTWSASAMPQDWKEGTWTRVGSARPTLDYDTLSVPTWRAAYNAASGLGVFVLPPVPSSVTTLYVKIVAQPLDSGATGASMAWYMDYAKFRDNTAAVAPTQQSLGSTSFQTTGVTVATYSVSLSTLSAQEGDLLGVLIYPNTAASGLKATSWLVLSITFTFN